MDFKSELISLINKYSMENGSDTPDFILADYLLHCLHVFNTFVNLREKWYNRNPKQLTRPTIKELEDILNRPDTKAIVTNPDGSISVI